MFFSWTGKQGLRNSQSLDTWKPFVSCPQASSVIELPRGASRSLTEKETLWPERQSHPRGTERSYRRHNCRAEAALPLKYGCRKMKLLRRRHEKTVRRTQTAGLSIGRNWQRYHPDEEAASRYHCKVIWSRQRRWRWDLGSTNGKTQPPQNKRWNKLNEGDRITIAIKLLYLLNISKKGQERRRWQRQRRQTSNIGRRPIRHAFKNRKLRIEKIKDRYKIDAFSFFNKISSPKKNDKETKHKPVFMH